MSIAAPQLRRRAHRQPLAARVRLPSRVRPASRVARQPEPVVATRPEAARLTLPVLTSGWRFEQFAILFAYAVWIAVVVVVVDGVLARVALGGGFAVWWALTAVWLRQRDHFAEIVARDEQRYYWIDEQDRRELANAYRARWNLARIGEAPSEWTDNGSGDTHSP